MAIKITDACINCGACEPGVLTQQYMRVVCLGIWQKEQLSIRNQLMNGYKWMQIKT